jgi:hypothetical protein
MRRSTVAMTTLFALMFWQVDRKTNAAAVPDVNTNPYLPIQRLEPIY